MRMLALILLLTISAGLSLAVVVTASDSNREMGFLSFFQVKHMTELPFFHKAITVITPGNKRIETYAFYTDTYHGSVTRVTEDSKEENYTCLYSIAGKPGYWQPACLNSKSIFHIVRYWYTQQRKNN